MKQTGIYLILGGAVVFILVLIGDLVALLFDYPLHGLALMAVVIGVFILLYSIIQEDRVAKNDEPFRGIDK